MAGKQRTARAIWTALSGLLSWCLERGYIDHHPLSGKRGPEQSKPEIRDLSLEELKKIWKAADCLPDMQASLIRFLMLTGQRNREVCQLQSIDIDGDWWVLKAERSKNKLDNHIFLTEFMRSFLPVLKMKGHTSSLQRGLCQWFWATRSRSG